MKMNLNYLLNMITDIEEYIDILTKRQFDDSIKLQIEKESKFLRECLIECIDELGPYIHKYSLLGELQSCLKSIKHKVEDLEILNAKGNMQKIKDNFENLKRLHESVAEIKLQLADDNKLKAFETRIL